MDQVVAVLERYLSILNEYDESKTITSTMINNYVKQRVVRPPQKKRYDRDHIAYFFAVCVLKRFMNIPEISAGMKRMLSKYELSVVYNIFCVELESALHYAFAPERYPDPAKQTPPPEATPKIGESELPVIKALSAAYANLMYARYLISQNTLAYAARDAEKNDKSHKDKD